jgi:hypothetical protein
MAGMPGEQVKVTLERSGGVVGRPIRRGLDTSALPPDEADRLRSLAARVHGHDDAPATASGPDRFAYRLEIERRGRRDVRTFSEPVPDELAPLVALLRKAPLLPARR